MPAVLKTSRAAQNGSPMSGVLETTSPASRTIPDVLLREVRLEWTKTRDDYDGRMRALPFTISFVYPKGGEPVCVKGGSQQVHTYVEEHYGNIPHITHTTYWKHGCRSYSIDVHIPNRAGQPHLWFCLSKARRRSPRSWETNDPSSVQPPHRHEKWVLYQRINGQARYIRSYRNPPRVWIKELDAYLPA